MTEHEIHITTPDGPFAAFIVEPAISGPAPAIVVIQEIFGINANIRAIARLYAAQGYLAIAPDLFWRQEPGIQLTDQSEAEWARAFELFKGFDVPKGVKDIQATINHIRQDPRCNGKVGAVGFCLGGLLAYLTAAYTDIDASVGYYGVGIETKLDEAKTITKPVLLHIAALDSYCPPAAQHAISAAFAGSPLIQVQIHADVDHGFARIGGNHFDKAATDSAYAQTLDVFKKALG
jgi:carboxymethylenebutenolidase